MSMRRRVRGSRAALVGMVMILAGCVPPSGAGDARHYDLGVCGQFEVRIGGTDGGVAFVAVRKYGLTLNWYQTGSGSCRVYSLAITTGTDPASPTGGASCVRNALIDTCTSYSDPLGGTWYQVATSSGPLLSARVGLSDSLDPVATRYLDVYP
jgi:hypothetical protein